jgi:hypothetical protein
MYRHLKSAKHKRLLAKNSVLKHGVMLRCSCRRDVLSDDFFTHLRTPEHKTRSRYFPSIVEVEKMLEEAFEKQEEMTTQKYLETCNACQNIFKFNKDPDRYSNVVCVNNDGVYRLFDNRKIFLLPNE